MAAWPLESRVGLEASVARRGGWGGWRPNPGRVGP